MFADMFVLLPISKVAFYQMVRAGGESGELAAAVAVATDSELGFVQLPSCLTFLPFPLLSLPSTSSHSFSLLPVTHPHVQASLKGRAQPRLMHLGPHLSAQYLRG